MATLTGERRQKLMTTVTTFDACKAMLEIATIEKPENHFLNVGSPKTKFRRKSIIVDPAEFLEIVLDTAIPSGSFRIARTVDGPLAGFLGLRAIYPERLRGADCWSIVHGLYNIGEQKANGKQKRFSDWIYVSIMDKRFFESARPRRFGEEIEGRDIAHGGRFQTRDDAKRVKGRFSLPPSHTTRHAGPHRAVTKSVEP